MKTRAMNLSKTRSILTAAALSTLIPNGLSFAQEVENSILEEESIFRERTPFLGAGFTYLDKSFKSDCMDVESVPEEEITANFEGEFKELNEETFNQIKQDTTIDEDFKYWFFSSRAKFNTKTNETTKRTYKQVYAEFTIDTFYERLLTSNSAITKDALDLIKKDNLNLFLRACGDHYVKSLGRKKKYIALLTYKVDENNSDSKFTADLHAEFSGFFTSLKSTTDFKFSQELIAKAKRSELSIEVSALGIGLKDLDPDLFPESLEDLNKSIKAAMNSFKNSKTGIVTKVEIAPWTSNPKFLNEMYNRLIERGEGTEECKTIPAANGADVSPSAQECKPSSKTISSIQLNNFMRNSGSFFKASSMLDYVNYLEQDYSACQTNFYRFRSLESGTRQFLFKNRYDLSTSIPSEQLGTEVFNEQSATDLITSIDGYLNDKNASKGNPYECLDQLDSFDKLLNTRRATACANIQILPPRLSTFVQYVDQYCPIQVTEIKRLPAEPQ